MALNDLDSNWRAYGAGITITGSTFRALRAIGVLEEVIAQGFACREARTRTSDGTLLQEIADIGLEPRIPYGGILRPLLHRTLADHMRRAGVTVKLGLTVDRIETDDRRGTWTRLRRGQYAPDNGDLSTLSGRGGVGQTAPCCRDLA